MFGCQVLFELARYHAPSTIFLDEVDALMTVRGGEGEHEASRRMKTEFLIQMDGLAKSDAHVFVLAATNLPWHLDSVSRIWPGLGTLMLVAYMHAEGRLQCKA